MAQRPSWIERILGSRDRLGWWTLPVFVMVGLGGAILAGALATVYYGQQVDALEEETREGRNELRDAVINVEDAGQEALAAIEEQVAAVRDSLTRELPFEDVTTSGVVALRVTVGGRPSGAAQNGSAAPAGDARPSGAVLARQEPTEPPPDEQEPDQQEPSPQPPGTAPSPQPSPSPPPSRPRQQRVASGFTVASDGGTTFIATTHALIADPASPGGVVAGVEVITPAGTFPGVVHSWDAGRDLALIRAEIGRVELLEWRRSDAALRAGDRIVAAGVTPTLNTVQITGQVAFVDVTMLITDLPVVEFLRGAPIVDSTGLVVGMVSADYAPFGSEAGDRQAMVPIQLLCERMLRNCDALEADPDAEADG